AISVVVVSLLIIGMFFQPKWNPIIMTSGVYAKLPVYKALTGSEDHFINLLKLYKLKYYAEGKQDVVSVIEMPSINERPYYALAVDGKVDASTGNADMSTQILSGQLPFIFDRKPRNALVIGLASGITAGALTFHSLKNISIVEIEPDMKYASKIFNKFNHNVLKNKNVNLIIDDGRHYLNVTNKKFDMIVSEPSNPWMAGPSRLFTKEFYEIVKKRLTSNGLFAQWIPLYGMGTQYFKSLIKTYLSAFPNVVSFQVSDGDLLLIGSPAKLKISTKRLQQLFNNKNIKNELKSIGINNPAEILNRLIGDEKTLKSISENARINTDNNGFVEFGAPKYLDKSTISQNTALLQKDKNFNELISIIKWDSPLLSPDTLILSLGKEALKTNKKNTVTEIIHFLNVNRYKNSALFLKGLLSSQMKENQEAKIIYERIIASDPLFSRIVYWKLLNLFVTQQEYNKAQLLLGKVPKKFRKENYLYWKGLVLLLKGSPKSALLTFAKVKLNGLTEPKYFYYLFNYVAASRAGKKLLVSKFENEFRNSLTKLRLDAEKDKSVDKIQGIIDEVQHKLPNWLTDSELQFVKYLIMKELLQPLRYYNNGINALFTGRFSEAKKSFKKVIANLPDNDKSTNANYFLRLMNN
ncbi:MAG TPA: hypothetical protein ENI76_05480, partial [Ignavibacteria bacterium]|nr:hypothetical protein [Ignavibacteria bacterium]